MGVDRRYGIISYELIHYTDINDHLQVRGWLETKAVSFHCSLLSTILHLVYLRLLRYNQQSNGAHLPSLERNCITPKSK